MLANQPIKQVENDFDRSWTSDDYFDLIVWHQADGQIHGFQLCYDNEEKPRALTWTRDKGASHALIDSGEKSPTSNRAPILSRGGTFPAEKVRKEFLARGKGLAPEICDLVLEQIAKYASQALPPAGFKTPS